MASAPFQRLAKVLYSEKVLPFTNTATGLVFFGIGDLVVQWLVEHKQITAGEVDLKRVGKLPIEFWEP